MADSHYDAPTRIQELLEYLHEREVDLETLADSKRNRLEQCVQLRNFEVEARQVKKTQHINEMDLKGNTIHSLTNYTK